MRNDSGSAVRAAILMLSLSAGIAALAIGGTTGYEKALSIGVTDPALEWGACPQPFPAGCEITVLHGDPARPNADVFLRVPSKYEIPPHWHSSPERMVLIAGELHVTYQGQAESVLRPGAYAYGPARVPHEATCTSTNACVLFIAFESPVDAHAFEGSLG